MSGPVTPSPGGGLPARLFRSLPALLWMAAIFYWSSQTSLPIDGQPASALFHRVAHLVVYAILALLVRFAVEGWPAPQWLALAITIAYGVSDELHQALVPSRTGTLRDVLLDSAAASVTLLLLVAARRRRRPGRELASPGAPL